MHRIAGVNQLRAMFRGRCLDDLGDNRMLRRAYNNAILFDDACLLGGDLFERVAEVRLMIKVHWRDHRYHWVRNVCRIEASPHADFEDLHIARTSLEPIGNLAGGRP